MDAELRSIDPLLQKWRELPAGDRRNILQRLPVEQRLTFERMLAASARTDAEAAARAQRFRACSSWLGELLDACEKDAPAAGAIKPAVREALLEGHEKIAEKAGTPEVPLSLAGIAQSLLKSVMERL
jgi:hypothetical protein